ncbi:MAG: ATP-binding protein [Oscillospiraceae bacterium]|nr:ATP-binding protein [Oscillospiraceae bacterium]
MSIRRKILIPMIILTIVACAAVLVTSIILFTRELENTMLEKTGIAERFVLYELESIKSNASMAASGLAMNRELVYALMEGDREKIAEIAIEYSIASRIDYSSISDADGNVYIRTHDLDNYGDNIAHLTHIQAAHSGDNEAHIIQGVTIKLGISAGAPVYDPDNNIIGVVSLGYRLDTNYVALEANYRTGCEIAFFKNDERVASSLTGEDGIFSLGETAPENISSKVLAGETYISDVEINGHEMLIKAIPLYGAHEIVGMVFIGHYTAEDSAKITFFIITGTLITLAVLVICLFISMYISKVINERLDREREKADEANERAALMLDSSPLCTQIWDRQLNTIDCNEAAVRLYGFKDKEDYISRFITSCSPEIQPDGQRSDEKAVTLVNKAFEEGICVFSWTHKMPDDDILIPAEVTLVRGKYKDDDVVFGYTRDLRSYHAMMQEMNEANERAMLMLDTSPLCTQIWDRELNTIDCNEAAVRLYGFKDKAEYVKRFIRSCSPEYQPDGQRSDEKAVTLVNQAFEDGYCVFEWMHKMPDENTLIPAEVTLVRGKYGGDDVVIGYTRDLRDYKAYLEQLEKTQETRLAKEAAEAANKTKSQFLANMSHEIRTPMNSIIGFSELAQSDDIPDKTRTYLESINESAEWLLSIINDILDISKIESGSIKLEKIPFNLHDIFSRCRNSIQPKADEKEIMLYCYAEPNIGKKLLGDPTRLRQVLINLLSNAVKFTNIGTVKLLATVTKSDENHISVLFEVKDSGIGMSQSQIDSIFDPFVQADDSITRKYGGTGLGLTISKSVVELMGGKIGIDSAQKVGSRFYFELTFEVIDDDSVDLYEDDNEEMEMPNFTGEVLIFEDNKLNQLVICDHLERVGLTTMVANNGQEGVLIVEERIKNKEKPFNLIFMDIHMPVMDGLDAASKLIQLGVTAPIIALTANIMSHDIELYKANGMIDCVGKPFTTQELWKILLKHMSEESFTSVDSADKKKQVQRETVTLDKLRSKFVSSNLDTFSIFSEALKNNDIKTAHRIAHTLKSGAGLIEEKELQSVAAEAESKLENGKSSISEKQVEDLGVNLESVLNKLKPLVESKSNETPILSAASEEIHEIIKELEPLLKGKSTKSQLLLEKVHTIPGAKELAAHISDYNFKMALSTLKKLKSDLGIE